MAEKKKKEPKYSTGRAAAATFFGPYHSAVAAKPGKKLRATGRTLGHSLAGGVGGATGGAALGAIATRGKNPAAPIISGQVGGQAGSATGAYTGFRANNKRGRYKVEKSNSVSAFGIDHG